MLANKLVTPNSQGKMSASTEHALLPIVRPDQAAAFEDFAKQTYKDQGYPQDAGYSDFGFGIWLFDPDSPYDDGRRHDVEGATDWGTAHEIMTPILHLGYKTTGWDLMNGHANPFFGRPHDSLINCAEARKEAHLQDSNSTLDMEPQHYLSDVPTGADTLVVQPMPPCTVFTDMFPSLHRDSTASGMIYVPVYPKNDPYTVVAMIGTTVFWEDILLKTVP